MRNVAFDIARQQGGADEVTVEAISRRLLTNGRLAITPDTERDIRRILEDTIEQTTRDNDNNNVIA